MNMKTIFTIAFASLMFSGQAQDTLDCKKDLSYESKGGFYYKKGDDSKAPVTGNAICHPKKGMVNRGRLVNGKWNGLVTGYEDGKVVGKAHYKNGLMDGLKLCYADNGKTKDSSIYADGDLRYAYTVKFKNGNRTETKEMNMETNTTVYTYYDRINGMEYVAEVNRFKGAKKDGLQEIMKGESDAPGSLFTYTAEEQKYVDGELKTITYYDHGKKYKVNDYSDGKLAIQNDIDENGNVSASYPLKKGKKHGTAIIYNANGEKPTSAEYARGKLVMK